jgi:hypothetical protein
MTTHYNYNQEKPMSGPNHQRARIEVGKLFASLDGFEAVGDVSPEAVEIIDNKTSVVLRKVLHSEVLKTTETGPQGGRSTSVLHVVELTNGEVLPVISSVYCDKRIEDKFHAVIEERVRDAYRKDAMAQAVDILKHGIQLQPTLESPQDIDETEDQSPGT